MAKVQRRRSSSSPLAARLRAQLQSARSRASSLRKDATKAYSAPIVLGTSFSGVSGGATAGAVMGATGGGMIPTGVVLVIAVLLILLGAFMVKGAWGGVLAAYGAGMGAKLAGDLSEDLVAGMLEDGGAPSDGGDQ